MIRPVLLFLTLSLVATPAAADWDRTRWGMTPQAVKALYPAAVPSGDPALVDPAKPLLQLEQPYVFDGQTFDLARLFFRNAGGLDRVEFMAMNAQDKVPGLLAWLEQRYGPPVFSEGPTQAPSNSVEILEVRYRPANGDRVVFMVLWTEGVALVGLSWEPPAA
ncbi:MAG: hypothetical protein K1X35_14655 [Caulobacteraceae bacterium]|nr:hypothetical protein [Caulobacteraceae bacterium]